MGRTRTGNFGISLYDLAASNCPRELGRELALPKGWRVTHGLKPESRGQPVFVLRSDTKWVRKQLAMTQYNCDLCINARRGCTYPFTSRTRSNPTPDAGSTTHRSCRTPHQNAAKLQLIIAPLSTDTQRCNLALHVKCSLGAVASTRIASTSRTSGPPSITNASSASLAYLTASFASPSIL